MAICGLLQKRCLVRLKNSFILYLPTYPMNLLPIRSTQNGETLIGLLIAVAVFALLGSAIFTLTSSSYSLTGYSRSRIAARHLAQEKLELIRNLPYDQVGTVGGIPAGPLAQVEVVQRNGLNYTVTTSIVYVDDPFDGTAPIDLLPTDYKSVRVDVSWEGLTDSGVAPVVLVSNVVPQGVESTEGGGTLSILVFDAQAQPVAQADVHIAAATTNPVVDLDLQTNSNGRIVLPGSPECTACYQITVTKTGYSSDRTYSTAEVANPSRPHQSVVEGQQTEISFAIDKVSTLTASSLDSRANSFAPLPNITFNLRGDKAIGTDINDDPVYKFEQDFATDASGNLTITDVEWDNYTLSLPGGTYDIAGTNPLLPFVVLPDTTFDFDFTLAASSANSLLITFLDDTAQPIASVSANLANIPLYDDTLTSGGTTDPDFGQVFFPDLSAANYNLTATASGYLDHTESVTVSGYTKLQSILTTQ